MCTPTFEHVRFARTAPHSTAPHRTCGGPTALRQNRRTTAKLSEEDICALTPRLFRFCMRAFSSAFPRLRKRWEVLDNSSVVHWIRLGWCRGHFDAQAVVATRDLESSSRGVSPTKTHSKASPTQLEGLWGLISVPPVLFGGHVAHFWLCVHSFGCFLACMFCMGFAQRPRSRSRSSIVVACFSLIQHSAHRRPPKALEGADFTNSQGRIFYV
jgi:hypothetical protein